MSELSTTSNGCTLCVRTQQRDDQVLDQWYGVVLLYTELDDERLMRLRLERLLCWRESPERWSCYQHMLPVLILARTPRQREHWQRAVETTALKLRLDLLAGAMTCVSSENMARMNPWLFNWRTLATDVSCHLQDLLKPLPPAAFPSSLRLEVSDEGKHAAWSTSNGAARLVGSGVSARLCRLIVGDLTKHTAQITQDDLEEWAMVPLLGLRLTPCQWSILHQLRCLEPVVTSAGKRWHLSECGLRLVAVANHMHIQHTAGIYSFFASLAHAATEEAEHELCWWETGAM
jgi:hypothetical protein